MDSTNLDIISSALHNLSTVPVPDDKINLVFNKLMQRIRAGNVLDSSCRLNLFIPRACDVLNKLRIPDNCLDELISLLLSKIDDRDDDSCIAVMKTLATISLSQNRCEEVIKKILIKAEDGAWPVKKAAWRALIKLNFSQEEIGAWIDNQLQLVIHSTNAPPRMGFESGSEKKYRAREEAIVCIATASIPESHREKVINVLLKAADNTKCRFSSIGFDPASDGIRRVACLALGIIKPPSSLCDVVFEKLIERLRDGIREAFDALKNQVVPEKYHFTIVTILLEKLRSKSDSYNSYEIFNLLKNIPVPKELTQSVLDELQVRSSSEKDIEKVILVLTNPSFPVIDEKTLECRIDECRKHKWLYTLYDMLDAINLPQTLHKKLYHQILIDIDDFNLTHLANVLFKINLDSTQREVIIDRLLTRLTKEGAYGSKNIARILIHLCNGESMRIAVLIKLESIAENNFNARHTLNIFMNAIGVIRNLPAQLPTEVKEHICQFQY